MYGTQDSSDIAMAGNRTVKSREVNSVATALWDVLLGFVGCGVLFTYAIAHANEMYSPPTNIQAQSKSRGHNPAPMHGRIHAACGFTSELPARCYRGFSTQRESN